MQFTNMFYLLQRQIHLHETAIVQNLSLLCNTFRIYLSSQIPISLGLNYKLNETETIKTVSKRNNGQFLRFGKIKFSNVGKRRGKYWYLKAYSYTEFYNLKILFRVEGSVHFNI